MSLPRTTPWHPLPHTSNTIDRTSAVPPPPLLVKTEFTRSSYAVHLTDLSRVWTEKLDARAIGARAQHQGTTIRPADDASQLLLLLETLEAAFYGGGGEADDVELVLASSIPGGGSGGSSDGGCELRLKLTCELPAPLPELEWTFALQQGSAIDFTNEFVLPLVATASLVREKVESLHSTIQAKDRVIETLRDAVEDFGIKAETLVGVRRRKALAVFDWERFDRGYRGLQEEKSGREVVREVFGPQAGTTTATTTAARPVGRFAAEAAGWWRGIQDDGQETSQSTIRAEEEGKDVPEARRKGEGEGEGEEGGVGVGSETEDEDDFEVSSVAPSRFRGLLWTGQENPPARSTARSTTLPATTVSG